MKTFILSLLLVWPAGVWGDSLQGPVNIPAGVNTRGLAVGDLDNDGLNEVVVANFGAGQAIGQAALSSTSSVQIFKRGAGGLKLWQTLATGNSPRGVAIADLNNDHRPDLLVTYYGENTLGVYLQNSDGTFAAPVKYATGRQPVGVAWGLSQGKALVAVANYGSSDLSLFVVQPDGRLVPHAQSPVSLAPALNPMDVIFINLNGEPYLVTANNTSNNLSVLGVNAAQVFGASLVAIQGALSPCKLARGDLNNDGKDDLAVAMFGDSKVALLMQSNELFDPPVLVTLKGLHPNGVTIGDVTGCGKPEVITADRDSDLLDVVGQKADGSWAVKASLSVAPPPGQAREANQGLVDVAAADLAGDAKTDLVAAYNQSNGSLKLFTQMPPATLVVSSPTHPGPDKWYPDPNPSFKWEEPEDLNGIARYCWAFDQVPDTVPALSGLGTTETQVTVYDKPAGIWYFHVLAVDNCGNVGGVTHFRVQIGAEMSKENTYNYPNPTRDGRTFIRFPLSSPASVSLRIYDEMGNLVWSKDLAPSETIAGLNNVVWPGVNDRGRAVGNGGYILKVSSGDIVIVKKIAVIR